MIETVHAKVLEPADGVRTVFTLPSVFLIDTVWVFVGGFKIPKSNSEVSELPPDQIEFMTAPQDGILIEVEYQEAPP